MSNQERGIYPLPEAVNIRGTRASVQSRIDQQTMERIPEVVSMIHYGLSLGPEVYGARNDFARTLGFSYSEEVAQDPEKPDKEITTLSIRNEKLNNGVTYEGRARVEGTGYAPVITLYEVTSRETSNS